MRKLNCTVMGQLQYLYDITRCDMPSQAPDFAHLTGHGKIPLNQPPLGVEIRLFVESFSGI